MDAKRSLAIAVAVVAGLAMLVASPGIGSATAAGDVGARASDWTIQALPTPALAPNGHLSAVSCLSVASCWAVGYSHDGSGVDVSLAEHWDGTRWAIEATPNPHRGNNTFLTGVSCSSPTACTAVGDYVDGVGQQVALAERWDGRRWEIQPMSSPSGATSTFLTSVSCASSSRCSAVGYSSRGAGQTTSIALRWDGATWQSQEVPTLSGGTSSRLSSVGCASASACTAVGFSGDVFAAPQPFSARWNGVVWQIEPTPQPPGATRSVLSSVSCPTATECVAVGYWHDNGKGGGSLAEHWDGTAWTATPTPGGPTDVYNAVSCPTASACLVVGKRGLADFVAARWDGTTWTSTATPASGPQVDTNYRGLSCTTLSACVAVGASETATFDFTYLTLAAGWNGSSWANQVTPNPLGATSNDLVAVSCATEQFCVAVGYHWKSPSVAEPLVERWSGTRWSVDSTPPLQGSSLDAVSCAAEDDCLAVGSFVDSTGQSATLAEHWNGASWQVEATPVPAGSVGAGFSGVSCATAVAGNGAGRNTAGQGNRGVCVAVGAYGDASGATVMLAERRTATAWQIQPVTAPVGTVAGALYGVSCATLTACTALGAFHTASPTPSGPPGPCDFSCMVSEQWNGTSWEPHQPPAPQSSISSSLPSVSCYAPGACTAAGQWTPQDRAGGHPGITLADYWNGASWTIQATPDPPGVGGPNGTNNSPFESVSCASANSCTAVGNYDSGAANGAFLPLAEHRDASGWSVQAMPAPLGTYYNDLRGVSCPGPRMCMAVGMSYRYNVANNSPGPHVALAQLYRRA